MAMWKKLFEPFLCSAMLQEEYISSSSDESDYEESSFMEEKDGKKMISANNIINNSGNNVIVNNANAPSYGREQSAPTTAFIKPMEERRTRKECMKDVDSDNKFDNLVAKTKNKHTIGECHDNDVNACIDTYEKNVETATTNNSKINISDNVSVCKDLEHSSHVSSRCNRSSTSHKEKELTKEFTERDKAPGQHQKEDELEETKECHAKVNCHEADHCTPHEQCHPNRPNAIRKKVKRDKPNYSWSPLWSRLLMCRPEVYDPHVERAPFNSGLSLSPYEQVETSPTSFDDTHHDTLAVSNTSTIYTKNNKNEGTNLQNNTIYDGDDDTNQYNNAVYIMVDDKDNKSIDSSNDISNSTSGTEMDEVDCQMHIHNSNNERNAHLPTSSARHHKHILHEAFITPEPEQTQSKLKKEWQEEKESTEIVVLQNDMNVATPTKINLLHAKNNANNALHGTHDSLDSHNAHDLQHGIIGSEMTKNEIIYEDYTKVDYNKSEEKEESNTISRTHTKQESLKKKEIEVLDSNSHNIFNEPEHEIRDGSEQENVRAKIIGKNRGAKDVETIRMEQNKEVEQEQKEIKNVILKYTPESKSSRRVKSEQQQQKEEQVVIKIEPAKKNNLLSSPESSLTFTVQDTRFGSRHNHLFNVSTKSQKKEHLQNIHSNNFEEIPSNKQTQNKAELEKQVNTDGDDTVQPLVLELECNMNKTSIIKEMEIEMERRLYYRDQHKAQLKTEAREEWRQKRKECKALHALHLQEERKLLERWLTRSKNDDDESNDDIFGNVYKDNNKSSNKSEYANDYTKRHDVLDNNITEFASEEQDTLECGKEQTSHSICTQMEQTIPATSKHMDCNCEFGDIEKVCSYNTNNDANININNVHSDDVNILQTHNNTEALDQEIQSNTQNDLIDNNNSKKSNSSQSSNTCDHNNNNNKISGCDIFSCVKLNKEGREKEEEENDDDDNKSTCSSNCNHSESGGSSNSSNSSSSNNSSFNEQEDRWLLSSDSESDCECLRDHHEYLELSENNYYNINIKERDNNNSISNITTSLHKSETDDNNNNEYTVDNDGRNNNSNFSIDNSDNNIITNGHLFTEPSITASRSTIAAIKSLPIKMTRPTISLIHKHQYSKLANSRLHETNNYTNNSHKDSKRRHIYRKSKNIYTINKKKFEQEEQKECHGLHQWHKYKKDRQNFNSNKLRVQLCQGNKNNFINSDLSDTSNYTSLSSLESLETSVDQYEEKELHSHLEEWKEEQKQHLEVEEELQTEREEEVEEECTEVEELEEEEELLEEWDTIKYVQEHLISAKQTNRFPLSSRLYAERIIFAEREQQVFALLTLLSEAHQHTWAMSSLLFQYYYYYVNPIMQQLPCNALQTAFTETLLTQSFTGWATTQECGRVEMRQIHEYFVQCVRSIDFHWFKQKFDEPWRRLFTEVKRYLHVSDKSNTRYTHDNNNSSKKDNANVNVNQCQNVQVANKCNNEDVENFDDEEEAGSVCFAATLIHSMELFECSHTLQIALERVKRWINWYYTYWYTYIIEFSNSAWTESDVSELIRSVHMCSSHFTNSTETRHNDVNKACNDSLCTTSVKDSDSTKKDNEKDAVNGNGRKELSVFAKESEVVQYCQLRIPMHWDKAQDNNVRFEVSVGRRQHMYRTLFFANERITRWHQRTVPIAAVSVTPSISSTTDRAEEGHQICINNNNSIKEIIDTDITEYFKKAKERDTYCKELTNAEHSDGNLEKCLKCKQENVNSENFNNMEANKSNVHTSMESEEQYRRIDILSIHPACTENNISSNNIDSQNCKYICYTENQGLGRENNVDLIQITGNSLSQTSTKRKEENCHVNESLDLKVQLNYHLPLEEKEQHLCIREEHRLLQEEQTKYGGLQSSNNKSGMHSLQVHEEYEQCIVYDQRQGCDNDNNTVDEDEHIYNTNKTLYEHEVTLTRYDNVIRADKRTSKY